MYETRKNCLQLQPAILRICFWSESISVKMDWHGVMEQIYWKYGLFLDIANIYFCTLFFIVNVNGGTTTPYLGATGESGHLLKEIGECQSQSSKCQYNAEFEESYCVGPIDSTCTSGESCESNYCEGGKCIRFPVETCGFYNFGKHQNGYQQCFPFEPYDSKIFSERKILGETYCNKLNCQKRNLLQRLLPRVFVWRKFSGGNTKVGRKMWRV